MDQMVFKVRRVHVAMQGRQVLPVRQAPKAQQASGEPLGHQEQQEAVELRDPLDQLVL